MSARIRSPRRASGRGPRDPALAGFQEISEAGARNAATALSQIIGRPVHLDVPWARPIPLDRVAEIAGGAERVVCALSLKVYGGARGNLLLVFGDDQLPLLLDLVGGNGGRARPRATAPLSELERSALREVGNILAGAYLNAVSRLLGLSLLPSIPGLAFDMVGAVTDYLLIELAPITESTLVLASQIREPVSGLRGEFFFLPDPGTMPVPAAAPAAARPAPARRRRRT